jgi:hypothetical protein
MNRLGIFAFSLLLLCCSASAVPMVRVVAVENSHTVVVDRNGVAQRLQLARVVVDPEQEEEAALWLRRTLLSAWVLVEGTPDAAYLYRSPDVMFINGELSRQRWLHANVNMTYLGEVDPGGYAARRTPRAATPARSKAPKAPKPPRPEKVPQPPKAPKPPKPAKMPKASSSAGVIR